MNITIICGAHSVLRAEELNLALTIDSTNVVLSWPSEAGQTYTVQHVSQLEDESFSRRNLAAGIEATPSLNVFTTPISGDEGFYRLLVGENVPSLPETLYNYENVTLPDHFLMNGFQTAVIDNDNTPAGNPITDAGATLGRVLFYDKKLSANGTVSCATCHVQEHGFSDSDILSEGFEGGRTRRHSMGLTNARFYQDGKFFWDERASTLEEQVLMPFQDDVEMGLTLEQLISIVDSQSYYPELFTSAFGDDTVTSDRIAKALAQFVRSLVSFTAPYDEGRAQVSSPLRDFPSFTEEENFGKEVFQRRRDENQLSCAGCHATEAFINGDAIDPTVASSQNNGLDAESIDDLGVRETSGLRRDTGRFKTPSLRNIAIRPPYMHDGRFATLEEVVEHYSSGIQDHPQLAQSLRDPDTEGAAQFNFTVSEKTALIAFLNTLTDEPFLTDPKFSDPFN